MNDRGEVSGNELLSENMNGKEKVSDTEVVEPIREEKSTLNSTASSFEQAAPSAEQDVPQAKGKLVRHQTHSGPLSSGSVLINSDSEKSHSYERFAPLANYCLRDHWITVFYSSDLLLLSFTTLKCSNMNFAIC